MSEIIPTTNTTIEQKPADKVGVHFMFSPSSMTLTMAVTITGSKSIRMEHEFLLTKVSHVSDDTGYRSAWLESSPVVLKEMADATFINMSSGLGKYAKSVDENVALVITKMK